MLFVRSEVYTRLQQAIIENYGLASGVMMDKNVTVNVETGLSDILDGEDDYLTVNMNFKLFGKFLVVRMPDDRMYNKIVMLDGVEQSEGHYQPDESAMYVDLLAIPLPAAFTNVRYMVENYLLPANMPGFSINEADLRKLNGRMFGNLR